MLDTSRLSSSKVISATDSSELTSNARSYMSKRGGDISAVDYDMFYEAIYRNSRMPLEKSDTTPTPFKKKEGEGGTWMVQQCMECSKFIHPFSS